MTSSSPASSIRLGSYQLFERLGEGASGHVHRAVGPDGAVAIKLLRPATALDDAARARFRREARALGEVGAPELITLIDAGVDDELGPYLVLPLVPGTTVRALAAGRALCPEAAILLALPIARAAVAIHAAGFVHRDLKPDNAIATPAGDVIVIDLGLAWAEDMSRWTEEGAAVGSVGYMAPEQIDGGAVGPGADVWALGVILYELACGRRPFARARASEEAAAALIGAFSPLAAADRRAGEELGALVAACLRRDPAARPTAAAVVTQLEAMIDWADARDAAALAAERAAVIADPAGYVARVAPFRARRLERLAREAVAARRPFAALALLDRALAYAPERAELEALVAEVEAAAATVVPPVEARAAAEPAAAEPSAGVATTAAVSPSQGLPPASARPWRAMIATAIVAAAAATAITIAIESTRGPAAPPAQVATTAAAIDAGAAAPAAGRAIDAAAPDPALGDPDLTSSPLADLPPIPLDRLRNDAPAFKLDLAAPAGEPIIPVSLLGGRTPDDAIRAVDDALHKDPGDQEAQVGQALVYMAAGRPRQGLQLLDEALRLHPTYQAGWAMKSYVEVRRGRWDAAEAAFARALELEPQDAKSLTNRGILRHRRGRVRDAYQDLRAALAIDPREHNAMYELVQLYQRNGHADQIGPILERIVRLDPSNATAWLDLSQAQAPRDAKASIERGLALDPASVRGKQRLCNVLTLLEDAGARAACDAALAVDDTDAEVWTDRGMTRYRAGDDAGALADLDRAIAIDPKDAQHRVDRAIVRAHAGQQPGATADLHAACDLGERGACAELANGPRKDEANLRP